MRQILLFIIALCMVFPVVAQDDIKHVLQAGDTWASLEATYDTCREAIIYHNDISLAGFYSPAYVMTAGTTFVIPSKTDCERLPKGSVFHTVLLGETAQDIFVRYGQSPYHYSLHVKGETPYPLFMDTELQPGDEIFVPDMVRMYKNDAELIVVDDASYWEPVVHTLQAGDTLDALAEQYQTCRQAIIWENQLMLASAQSIAYVFDEGDTILVPPATACDDLPMGEYTITIEERVTQQTLIRRYQQYEGTYYSLNTGQAGLLTVGTEQTIPNIESMYLGSWDLYVVDDSDDTSPATHTAQHGDTFDALARQYNTCIEVILYANDLHRNNANDPTFIVKAGTKLQIPPASACDTIPHDPITVEVQEGDTLWGISYHYNINVHTLIEASIDSPESQLRRDADSPYMKDENHIEPGLKLVVPDQSRQYQLKPWERLLVYDDDDIVIQPPANVSLYELAACYGLDVWDLYEINGLRDTRYEGGSLIIPDPQHDCILRNFAYRLGPAACYPEPLDNLLDIERDSPIPVFYRDEIDDAYCYEISLVYLLAFSDQNVILHHEYWAHTGAMSPWSLTQNMINYCFRHDKDALKDITWEKYDATVLPPDDEITIFALPEHIECNREMFNDFYVYQVQMFDSLSNIAKAYGTHPDLIAQANNMDNPHHIYVGQYLQIPTPTIFHILQGLGGLFVLLMTGLGLRWILRRPQDKIKRKPKVDA